MTLPPGNKASNTALVTQNKCEIKTFTNKVADYKCNINKDPNKETQLKKETKQDTLNEQGTKFKM